MRYPLLRVGTVKAAIQAAKDVGASPVATRPGGFGPAYVELRTAAQLRRYGPAGGSITWADKREGFLARHLAQAHELWTDGGEPTRYHLSLAVWAYSPEPARLRGWLRMAGYLP